MALNKKRILQIVLFTSGLLIIFFTYFFNLKKDNVSLDNLDITNEKIAKKDLSQKDTDDLNKFEDVEYKGVDINGNRFIIASKFADFSTETPEKINMQNIECNFYFKDGTKLKILSDFGIYNNISNDMEFTKNVKMFYLENILFSERANFFNLKNELIVQGDVKSRGPQGKLEADELNFDLNSKKMKISMYNDEKVNIKVNLQ
tara:strand:+ start:1745 stop:2353 length:609 start_codon:yes stop_codon:yes gene_type:complete